METLISKPQEIDKGHLQQIIELIVSGEQIEREGLETKLMNSHLVAYLLEKGMVLSTATLKNPRESYKGRVFREAQILLPVNRFSKELGYIATHSQHEGKKLCQKLLSAFFPYISEYSQFATTRKAAMGHILDKSGFKPAGVVYKHDLKVYIYDAS